ncbi:MAG: diaminopimelate epimerase [Candidatus Aminicenantes bacterium]|nr:diaminopimelate epimerase [Candidatus Aminicenantes bacterium]
MKFTKVHSLGNDFLLIDQEEWGNIPDLGGLVRRLCDRHMGVGADGVLLVSITDRGQGLARFRIFNADGTEPEISGNGLRCAAAGLFFQKKVEPPDLVFTTTTGRRECRLLNQENTRFHIRIEMGVPRFSSKDIPFDDGSVHDRIVDYPLSINQQTYLVTVLSIGNPHCLLFVDHFPARIEWHQIGREIESHPFFPNRTNVEFIRVRNRGEIEVLFWERGVGETLSSGSGSSACAIGAALKGLTDKTVKVITSQGSLTVDWTEDKVYQAGPAEVVFDGTPL